MSLVAQTALPLRDARWRPVKDMTGVKEALDIEAEEVEALIDLGHLIVFNIAVKDEPGAGDRSDPRSRRELRFLSRSVEAYRARQPFTPEWPEIFRLLVPHDKPLITGTEIDSALNCHRHHRQRLIESGELQMLDGTSWKAGPGGSPVITRASFENFLKERRL